MSKRCTALLFAKFFSKQESRAIDAIPDTAMMQLFREVLDRRLRKELVEPGIPEQMILKSGGVLRELIRIADLCCDKCMQLLRRQIRRGELDQPVVKIDADILAQVLTDLQITFAEPLGRTDYKLLKLIYTDQEPEDAENQRFLDLLHGLYVLEYRNAVQWYDLNPIVVDLLKQRGDL